MPTAAAIYVRISEDRDGTSASPDRQEKECRKLCEQKGWEVAGVYRDRDKSAYRPGVERPGYVRMLADLAAGDVDAIVVWKFDRLTRGGVIELGKVLGHLRDAGAKLACVVDNIDTSTPMGEGMAALFASQAKQESENSSLRIRSAQAYAAKEGRPHGGRRPYGYNRDNTVNEVEADVLREAASRFLLGDSLRAICVDFNARGITSATGRNVSSPTLGDQLRNPRYAGLRKHHDEYYPAVWAPIFDRAYHLQLVEALDSPSRMKKAPVKEAGLLTGLLRCGLCGRGMRTKQTKTASGKRYQRYSCISQPGEAGCGKVAISRPQTDDYISTAFLLEYTWRVHERLLSTTDSSAEIDELAARVAADEQALSDLSRARFYERSISAQDFTSIKRDLEQRRDANREALASQNRGRSTLQVGEEWLTGNTLRISWTGRLDQQHEQAAEETRPWFESLTVAEKREHLFELVKHVTVSPAKRVGGNRYDATRLAVVWR